MLQEDNSTPGARNSTSNLQCVATDFIDFQCSSTWLDFYYEVGLTPRHSASYGQVYTERLIKKIEELRIAISSLNVRFQPQRRIALPEKIIKTVNL